MTFHRTNKSGKYMAADEAATERTPLLVNQGIGGGAIDGFPAIEEQVDDSIPVDQSIGTIISVLLIGVFVSQADTCLVLATYGQISSEFNALQNGTLLITSYMLAQCAAQPLYGKLSDIFGRKRCLQVSYLLFATGTLGSGLSRSMPQILASRALEGCGGAGMVCMVSIVLTDLVPLNKVATYRGYVNLVQTTGRACGAAIGGILASLVGWRLPFLLQCPLVLAGLILIEFKLSVNSSQDEELQGGMAQKLNRIDFAGAFFMTATILCSLIALDMGGQMLEWTHPVIIAIAATAMICSVGFWIIEKNFAVEPIFPLGLLTSPAVLISYTTLFLQNVAISSLTFIVPMYFQICKSASVAEAGSYLVPSMVGNTIGGLLAGYWIGKTRRYKTPTIFGALSSVAAFTLLIIVWRGNTQIWVALLILPVGFALGVAYSAIFIALSACVEKKDIAIAASGLYLAVNVGMIAGVTLGTAVYQVNLKSSLTAALSSFPDYEAMVRKALSDIEYVQNLTGPARVAVLPVYIQRFQSVFLVGLTASVLCTGLNLLQKERRLSVSKK